MSAQTKAALDEALAAHLADEVDGGGIVTGYVLLASSANSEQLKNKLTAYLFEAAELQPFHVGLGLAHRLVLMLDREAFGDERE